ncbi:uncharacterized protein, partial [Battus philenor]|uniref:uncharacterized protein n=1 Tax=Battus philenor TaxID=42288 RepID=UPI0035CFDE08
VRPKKQSSLDSGSGAGVYDTYDGEDDVADYSRDDDDDNEDDFNIDSLPESAPPTPRPHRHHHGDQWRAPHTTTDNFQTEPVIEHTTKQQPIQIPPILPTTSESTQTELPTPRSSLPNKTTEFVSPNLYTTEVVNKVKITPYTETVSEAAEVDRALESNVVESRKLGHSPVIISPEDSSTTSEPELQTVIIRASNEVPPMSSEPPSTPTPSPPPSPFDTIPTETTTPSTTSTTTSSTTTSTTTTTTTTTMPTTIATSPTIAPTTAPTTTPTALPTTTPVPETTLQEVTKQDLPLSSERSSTIIGRTTETVTFPMSVNQPLQPLQLLLPQTETRGPGAAEE